MGMCLGLASIDDDTIAKVIADPPLVWKIIAPDDPDIFESERNKGRTFSWFSNLLRKKRLPVAESEIVVSAAENSDLDKAWHGIHYLLTKTAWEGEPPMIFFFLAERKSVKSMWGTVRREP